MKFIKLISAALAFLLIFGGCNKAQEDELPPGFDDTSDEEIEIAALEPYTLRIPYDYEEKPDEPLYLRTYLPLHGNSRQRLQL